MTYSESYCVMTCNVQVRLPVSVPCAGMQVVVLGHKLLQLALYIGYLARRELVLVQGHLRCLRDTHSPFKARSSSLLWTLAQSLQQMAQYRQRLADN